MTLCHVIQRISLFVNEKKKFMSNLIIFYIRLCYNLITVCHVIQINSSFVNEKKKKKTNKQTNSFMSSVY